ncbi:hypothetical protein TD95_004815 [Thielaviopsis punctulata]|uniref:Ribonuclease H n=1 Tax=Thielaviopsis punctulata TaxID=72032 RepID=A0A0F4ZLA9_9PEZI|nr:hypothetical protein TD95_004815 [Thielaviopsis punctulata]
MAGLKRVRDEADGPAAKRKRVDALQPKFYAVRRGRAQGVYYTWADCQAQIVGYKGAVFKSFPTESDAQAFVDGQNPEKPASSSRPIQEKFYAVARGNKAGIFLNWEETAASITGAVGPRFKKFNTRQEAMAFMRQYASPEAVKAAEAGLIVSGRNAEQGNPEVEAQSRKKSESKAKKKAGAAGSGDEDAEFANHVQVYTDGSSRGNGRVGAAAGVGVYFGPNDPRNVSERLSGEPQTNQRAELTAILFALQRVPVNRKILIITDSQYSINCATVWARSWAKKNWVSSTGEEVKNQDLVRAIIEQMTAREKAGGVTSFKWVNGHNKNPGNEAADALAVAGAMKPMV